MTSHPTPRVINLDGLRGFASGDHRNEISASDAAAGSNTMQQVLE
jgi:hypothetical protein